MFYYVHLLSGPQGKKRSVGCVAYDKRHEHGEFAFATAMRPSIASDGERLATDIVCCGSIASVWLCPSHFRFSPNSGGIADIAALRICARNGSRQFFIVTPCPR